MKPISLMFFLSVFFGCISNKKSPEGRVIEYGSSNCGKDYKTVSFVNLLDSAILYDGKYVEVEGFYTWDTEESAIAHSRSFQNKQKMIWVQLGNAVGSSIKQNALPNRNGFSDMIGKKIRIRGIVKANEHGHLGQYAASVTFVCYMQIFQDN
jgi:hypothetical protein